MVWIGAFIFGGLFVCACVVLIGWVVWVVLAGLFYFVFDFVGAC